MKRLLMIVMIFLLVLAVTACSNTKQTQYESLGTLSATITQKCPKCGTFTLKVEAGKTYGICSSCDGKYTVK